MGYLLTVAGEYRGEFDSLDAVFYELDSAFHSEDLDLFDDLSWELVGPDKTVSRTMCPNMWEAVCEDARKFELYFKAVKGD